MTAPVFLFTPETIEPADAVASSGARGGTLTDEADPPPPEHATAPHANTNAKAPHPARHHRRPHPRPDEPDDDPPHDTDESDDTDEPGDPPHDTDEPGDPPHDTDKPGDSPDDVDIGAPDGGRTGNHDTEELLPQGP